MSEYGELPDTDCPIEFHWREPCRVMTLSSDVPIWHVVQRGDRLHLLEEGGTGSMEFDLAKVSEEHRQTLAEWGRERLPLIVEITQDPNTPDSDYREWAFLLSSIEGAEDHVGISV